MSATGCRAVETGAPRRRPERPFPREDGQLLRRMAALRPGPGSAGLHRRCSGRGLAPTRVARLGHRPGRNRDEIGPVPPIKPHETLRGYSSDRTNPGQDALHGRAARGRSMLGGCVPTACSNSPSRTIQCDIATWSSTRSRRRRHPCRRAYGRVSRLRVVRASPRLPPVHAPNLWPGAGTGPWRRRGPGFGPTGDSAARRGNRRRTCGSGGPSWPRSRSGSP
jgi:hypothetical protein